MKKEIKDVHCRGRVPETRQPCNLLLYKSDGEFLIVETKEGRQLIINEGLDKQRIKCPSCGYWNTWEKNEKYRRGSSEKKGLKRKY